jgi:hypothetical protein
MAKYWLRYYKSALVANGEEKQTQILAPSANIHYNIRLKAARKTEAVAPKDK